MSDVKVLHRYLSTMSPETKVPNEYSDALREKNDELAREVAKMNELVREVTKTLARLAAHDNYNSLEGAPHLPAASGHQFETLTRARYKLPNAVAEALASFIKENFRSNVDAKVEDATLTVTAPEEDQVRIAGCIELLRDRATFLTPPKNPVDAEP
ncbi:MAG TPA: hypothetical protein VNH11_05845 [Pirellulales bacterium]|nr:hypothetical protein [Pirellulales bacterium]